MNSVCISSCIDDARDTRVPVRTTYVNLYKWPESDAEFVRSVRRGGGVPAARVVDSISCRQMYLRSYTFSREDEDTSLPPATRTSCLGRVKETVSCMRGSKDESDVIVEKAKPRRLRDKRRIRRTKREQACSVMFRFFRRLLSCAATIDVVDPN
ncbi:hypothetical protein HID58_008141 [Brassica napus]|uniref:BnaA03g00580D protein n=3 Tax=Brassica TaxID=3705 RepID=A0A078FDZ8_BRANA|nr:uncharacterized protein LOC106443011 [Brassica napus]KAH0931024.1 hypothetical protein HID58_008141 [Brassica napus]CAF2118224.1 unnamed protein product [Brassica napus]CDY11222.1 BnaA03g00580D [Brassica napus]